MDRRDPLKVDRSDVRKLGGVTVLGGGAPAAVPLGKVSSARHPRWTALIRAHPGCPAVCRARQAPPVSKVV